MKGGEWSRERGRTAGLCGHGIEAMATALAIHGFKSHRHRHVKPPQSLVKTGIAGVLSFSRVASRLRVSAPCPTALSACAERRSHPMTMRAWWSPKRSTCPGRISVWAVSSFVDDLFVDFRPRLRSGRSRRPGSRRGCGSRGWSAAGGGCRTPLCTASRRISLAAGSRRTAGSTSRS